MSNQLNRKVLKVNNRKNVEQKFETVVPKFKSQTRASIFAWASRGKGIEGESYNSSDANGFRQIINKRRKPM